MSASVRDRLRQAQFLEGVTDSSLHQLSKLVAPVTYECDAILFDEGAPRDFMAIILSGAVAIEKGMKGRPVRLVTLGAGQAVGEGLLLDDSPHGTGVLLRHIARRVHGGRRSFLSPSTLSSGVDGMLCDDCHRVSSLSTLTYNERPC